MTETYATLNGINLDLETISDSFDKAIVRHHIPFSDRTLIQDMGLKARRIRLRCYFWSDTYDTHKDVLKLLWGQQSFELNHPKYGLLQGAVDDIHVRHDDRDRTAEIDIDFIVGISSIDVSGATDIAGQADELAADGYLEAQNSYRDAMVADGVLDAETIDKALDPDQGILDQITAVSAEARSYLKKLDRMDKDIGSFCDDITSPVDSLVDTVELATSIPGRIIGKVAATVEKLTVRFIALKNAPGRFLDSIVNQLARFTYPFDSTLFGKDSTDSDTMSLSDRAAADAYLATSAIGLAHAAAQIYADDEQVRSAQAQAEDVQVFDAHGRMTQAPDVESALNVNQIEESLDRVRVVADLAVEAARGVDAVKLLSDALLDHVVQVKLDAEKIVTIDVDNAMPLHLVCLKYGLPYRSAERILRINRIKHPNFVSGEVDIYES